MNYNIVSDKLEKLSTCTEHNFNADYAGFQRNIEQALLYYLDSMFPTYRKYPELFTESCEDLRNMALRIGSDYLINALLKNMSRHEAEIITQKLIDRKSVV